MPHEVFNEEKFDIGLSNYMRLFGSTKSHEVVKGWPKITWVHQITQVPVCLKVILLDIGCKSRKF